MASIESLQAQLLAFRKFHRALYEELLGVKDLITSPQQTQGDRVDVVHLLRELSRTAEDARKECDKLSALATKIACIMWVSDATSNPATGSTIRGRLATGTPDVKIASNLPRRKDDPVKYAELLRGMGVPAEVAETQIVSIHWPSFVEWMTKLQAAGKPLPAGIDPSSTYPLYSMTVRRVSSPEEKEAPDKTDDENSQDEGQF